MSGGARRDLVLGIGALLLTLAASLSLLRAFLGAGWLPATWAAIALAVAIAAGARRLGVGGAAATVSSALVWTVFTYVVHLDAGGLLPGAEQVAQFVELVSQALSALAHEPAPARPLPSLLLVTTTAAWWVAHLTHELAVRARRPGAAIVGAAVLWVFPLAVPQPPGSTWPHALPFLAAAVVVLLLEPDTDLSARWRSSHRGATPGPVGLGIGTLALLIAVTVPGALPGYGQEPWVDLSAPDAARGYQPIVDVSRRLKLPAERDLLWVRSEFPLYLRLAGLDTFDGTTWRLGPAHQASFEPEEVIPADRRLPPEVPIAEAVTTTVEVENLSLENVFVPTPYRPVTVGGSAARRMIYSEDGTFLATSDTLEGEPALLPGLSYRVEAELPAPTPADLRTVGFDAYDDPRYARWTQLPTDYPALAELGGTIRAGSGATTPYGVAFALQDHLRDPDRFTYSTDVPALRDPDALQRFVLDDRRGYCEYFATAMAVMLRQQGIPSRVAVGFRLGDRIDDGQYLVTTRDAHAWVEVLFPGYGWIQFEPTPALPDALVPTPDDVTPRVAVGEAQQRPPTADGAPPLPADDFPNQVDRQEPPGGPDAQEPGTGEPSGDVGGALLPPVAGVLALAAVALVVARRRRRRRRPELDDVRRTLAAQRRVLEDARAHGVGRRDHETAREVGRRWAGDGRADGDDVDRLTRLWQAAAFGGELPGGAGAQAEELGERVTDQLRRSVPRTARLVAPVRVPYDTTVEAGRRLVGAVRGRPDG